jgi:hypothetical protein
MRRRAPGVTADLTLQIELALPKLIAELLDLHRGVHNYSGYNHSMRGTAQGDRF